MTLSDFSAEWHNDSDCVWVHTSGSTGIPKPLLVEKCRMEASARMTCDFLGLHEGDTALLCMPLDFIAGKMMAVRAWVRGLKLFVVAPSSHPLSDESLQACNTDDFTFVAMVPYQVFSSLQVPKERERLRQIRHLLIGGGAIDEALENELRDFPHAVWSTYGMTETLSHIALRRLNGSMASEWYTPMEHVCVSLGNEDCLCVEAPALCEGIIQTNDIAILHPDAQRFRILGRRDNVICSGGIKIQIEEVERLLHPHLHIPYLITRARDQQFGEVVVLLTEDHDVEQIRNICERVLPKYWQPRHFLTVAQIPLTATGKPDRMKAEKLASEINGMDC